MAISTAPLLGHNLVRLVYLDEAGTDQAAPFLCVAGVLVHGDYQWPQMAERFSDLLKRYIPETDWPGLIFHATDIYHGSGYFNRNKPEWADVNKRHQLLDDIAKIIDDMSLPIVAGTYEKKTFGMGVVDPLEAQKHESKFIHNVAAADCLMWADQWLERFAPSELATVIHEDGTRAKPMIKATLRILRDEEFLKKEGLSNLQDHGLPLKRIIDTVHFAEKADAPGLQLADLCAFIFGRGLKHLHTPAYATEVVLKYKLWINKIVDERVAATSSSA